MRKKDAATCGSGVGAIVILLHVHGVLVGEIKLELCKLRIESTESRGPIEPRDSRSTCRAVISIPSRRYYHCVSFFIPTCTAELSIVVYANAPSSSREPMSSSWTTTPPTGGTEAQSTCRSGMHAHTGPGTSQSHGRYGYRDFTEIPE